MSLSKSLFLLLAAAVLEAGGDALPPREDPREARLVLGGGPYPVRLRIPGKFAAVGFRKATGRGRFLCGGAGDLLDRLRPEARQRAVLLGGAFIVIGGAIISYSSISH